MAVITMEHSTLKPIELDFKDIRNVRQQNNNKIIYNSIKKNDMKTFYENVNNKEFKRTLLDLGFSHGELMEKCISDDKFCTVVSRLISKNASRQGSKDETEQLKTCNITSQQCKISITNLNTTDLRPTKDGQIISKNEMKNKHIPKDCCLKSFDGQISGKMNGFITAKVAYGSGGHQDNVFEEMDTIAEWWKTYKYKAEEQLIVLIDTDLITKFTRLKEKYADVNNIMVCNHIDFQHYIINTFHNDESI